MTLQHCKNEVININLKENRLYGWRVKISRSSVEEACLKIAKGEGFPPLYVERIDDTTYQLPYGTREFSQHLVAFAHYVLNLPVPCIVTGEVDEPGDEWEQLFNPELIRDMKQEE